MSTLTKIFIVLMVIFSIAFSMMAVSFVGDKTDWRSLAKGYKAQQQIAETNMKTAAAAHAAEKTIWLDAKNALDDRVAALEARVVDQQAEIAELRDELARERAEKSGSDALAQRLASELQIAQNGWLEQRKQREEIDNRNMELERRNLDLNERVNEQTAQIVVLVQEQRQLEQQINILKEENTKLARAGAVPATQLEETAVGLDRVSPVASSTGSPVRGSIVEVQGKILTISVGSSDGVQEGMVFVIHRGSQYVGDLEVTDVEPNLSAGRLVRSQTTPLPNDQVADEASL